jgi:hypothetical protein
VDAATGEKKVLVSAAKLASLAPDYANKVKDEREKERLTRYHVGSLPVGAGFEAPRFRFARTALVV